MAKIPKSSHPRSGGTLSDQISETRTLGQGPQPDAGSADMASLFNPFEKLKRIEIKEGEPFELNEEAKYLEGLLRAIFGEKIENPDPIPRSSDDNEFNNGNIDSDELISRDIHGNYIDREQSQVIDDLSLERRLNKLIIFSRSNSALDAKEFAHSLFAKELAEEQKLATAKTGSAELPLPDVAPIKWKDREHGETAPDFARRVYGPWLKEGMSKRALRKLDAALLNELNKWVREGNDMQSDIKLLSVGEENQRLLDAGPEAIREHLGKFAGREAIREAQRLGKNLSRSS